MKLFLASIVLAQVLSQNVESAILQDSRVEKFEYVVEENLIVIGLITTPIFLRSENIDVIRTVKSNVRSALPEMEVYVSIDADIFYKIKSLNAKSHSYSAVKALAAEVEARENAMCIKASS